MGLLTFSRLKESMRLMAVSRAVMDSRKTWSCSHRGLPSRSAEIFTAALDMAVNEQTSTHILTDITHMYHIHFDGKPLKPWLRAIQRVYLGSSGHGGKTGSIWPVQYSTILRRLLTYSSLLTAPILRSVLLVSYK